MQRREVQFQTGCTAAVIAGITPTMNAREHDITQMPDYSTTGAKLITNSTPADDGFFCPAEWERHDCRSLTRRQLYLPNVDWLPGCRVSWR